LQATKIAKELKNRYSVEIAHTLVGDVKLTPHQQRL